MLNKEFFMGKIHVLSGILVLILGFPESLWSQVGGISGSKLAAYCVDVVDHKKLEFEPAFFHARAKKQWDGQGNLNDLYETPDSVRYRTGFYFRFTYGLWDKLEIGGQVSIEQAISNWGVRYVLFNREKLGLAAIAGVNIPFGNGAVDNTIRTNQTISSTVGGAVLSLYPSTQLSVDVNVQYQAFIRQTEQKNKGSFFFNTDVGYYLFSRQLQLIGGIEYQRTQYAEYNEQILTVYPGITVETGKYYILVLSIPFDVYGRNTRKTTGMIFALTLIFE